MHTPCHTVGHILYYCESTLDAATAHIEVSMEHNGLYQHVKNINRCVFTGDTVFLGGCGKFFEGTAEQMLNAMDRFREFPDDTKIFCGHEYTIKNFEFAMMAEPDNEDIKKHFISFS